MIISLMISYCLNDLYMPLITPLIKNIKEVTEPLKEEILNGHVHTIDEMKAWMGLYKTGTTYGGSNPLGTS